MQIVSVPHIVATIILLALFTVVLVIARQRSRARLTEAYRDGFYSPSYESDDDRTLSDIHGWAEEARRDRRRREDSGSYDTRTLAELASACPACELDHEGTCELLAEYERDLLDDSIWDKTILTGKIVEEIPEPVQETAPYYSVPSYTSFTWELEHEWHQDTSGNWIAPWARVDSLPDGDWLKDLLVGSRELVAA